MYKKVISQKIRPKAKNADTTRISAILQKLTLKNTAPKAAPVKAKNQVRASRENKLLNILASGAVGAIRLTTCLLFAVNLVAGTAVTIAANILATPFSTLILYFGAHYLSGSTALNLPAVYNFFDNNFGYILAPLSLELIRLLIILANFPPPPEIYRPLNHFIIHKTFVPLHKNIDYLRILLETTMLVKRPELNQENLFQETFNNRPWLKKLAAKALKNLSPGPFKRELRALSSLKAEFADRESILERLKTPAALKCFIEHCRYNEWLKEQAKKRLQEIKKGKKNG